MNRFYYASVAPVIVKNQVIAGVSGDDMDNPGLCRGARPGDRRDAVALVYGAAEDGRAGSDTLAERGGHEARRRHDVDAGDLRSRTESHLRHDRQSAAGHRSQEPLGRQPVHRIDRRAQRRHGQDGLVLPVVAARHARLGRHADAGALRRRRSTASRASSSPRRRATATSSCSIAPTARPSSRAEFIKTNWSLGYDAEGQPIPNPAKMPQIDGALVSPNSGGAANWQSPTSARMTGLFYVNATRAFSVYYIYDPSDNPPGWGGTDRGGYSEAMLQAIDYKTGKIRWSHPWKSGGAAGVLSTAGNLRLHGRFRRARGAQRHDRRGALARAHRHGHERTDYLRAGWRAAHRRRLGQQRRGVRDEQVGRGLQ